MKKTLSTLLALSFLVVPRAHALTDKEMRELHLFSAVLHYVQESYVEPVDEHILIRGAILGMMRTLDPHTQYMSPEVYRELKVDTEGKFDGIGIELTMRDGKLVIISPIKGSPADAAGVQSGDQIININGRDTHGMTLSEAVKALRGPRGAKVNLVLRRNHQEKDGQEKTADLEVALIRKVIEVPNVRSELLDEHYGYVSIASFQQNTAEDLEKALRKMMKQTELKGVMLDLRRNPGGLLGQAVKVSDLFLEAGTIVSTESRSKEIDRRVATLDGTLPSLPLIVLVDGGTASASEIVAGALKDNKRAILLGTTTFGKGSVQNVLELEDGGALKLTVARYFTPSGHSIQASGISPDIYIPSRRPPQNVKQQLHESDLQNHLEVEPERKPVSKEPLADYQKQVALDYLKSWALFGEAYAQEKQQQQTEPQK